MVESNPLMSWVIMVPLLTRDPSIWLPLRSFNSETECEASKSRVLKTFPQAICERAVSCSAIAFNVRCR
jgi:hypothetical protein